MDEKKTITCIKQNFEVQIQYEKRGLVIQNTSLLTGIVYKATYFTDNLVQEVKDLIEDIEQLYDYIEKKIDEPDIVTVTPQGHLKIMTIKTFLTNKQTPKPIIIPTQQVKMEKLQIVNSLNSILSKQVAILKDEVKNLKMIVEEIEEKYRTKSRLLETQNELLSENSKKIYSLQKSVSSINTKFLVLLFIIILMGVNMYHTSKGQKTQPIQPTDQTNRNISILKIRPQFDAEIAQNYIFNQQTWEIIKTKDGQSQITSHQHLPNTGKYYFQLKIVQSKKQRQSIGIVTIDSKGSTTTLYDTNSIKYSAFNGFIFKEKTFTQAGQPIHRGSIIKVQIDMSLRTISWYVDNVFMTQTSLPERFVQKAIYVSIQIYNQSDKIQII